MKKPRKIIIYNVKTKQKAQALKQNLLLSEAERIDMLFIFCIVLCSCLYLL